MQNQMPDHLFEGGYLPDNEASETEQLPKTHQAALQGHKKVKSLIENPPISEEIPFKDGQLKYEAKKKKNGFELAISVKVGDTEHRIATSVENGDVYPEDVFYDLYKQMGSLSNLGKLNKADLNTLALVVLVSYRNFINPNTSAQWIGEPLWHHILN